jgi:hypothetical protein
MLSVEIPTSFCYLIVTVICNIKFTLTVPSLSFAGLHIQKLKVHDLCEVLYMTALAVKPDTSKGTMYMLVFEKQGISREHE